MALPSKTFSAFVQDMVSQWSASLGFTPTLQAGSAIYALMQTAASQIVFLQALIYVVNNVARAQTCGTSLNNGTTDADLDSFYAQFNFPRLPATYAEGEVTFAAAAPVASQVLIAPGVIVQTVGAAIQYQTIADPTQPTWNPSLNAYVLTIGNTSLTATVEATTAGASYNVTAGQLSQLAANVPGIVSVANGSAINNGLNAEANAAYSARFVNYLNSLSKATYGAIISAIQGISQGIRFNVIENVNTGLTANPGEFVAVVDNGGGGAPSELTTAVQAALENVRAFTVEAQTIGTTFEAPTISLSVRIASGYVQATVEANVQAAIAANANATPIGGGITDPTTGEVDGAGYLYIGQVEEAAMSVAGVVSTEPGETLINGENADYALSAAQGIEISTSDVSVGTY